MLLHEVLGPCSFADLRRFENQLLPTYCEAAAKTGILENDQQWDDTLEEAAVVRAHKQLRQLFAIMLLTCGMSNPKDLWDKHKESLAENFHHRCRREGMDVQVEFSELTFNETLVDLENPLRCVPRSWQFHHLQLHETKSK